MAYSNAKLTLGLLRYHLNHPLRLTPRPLRFSRTRALRHWAIHRAWQLHQAKMRKTAELALERQYNSMRSACEELRNLGDTGLLGTADDKILVDKDGRRVDVGWLYRRAMEKKGIWGEVPREYAGRMVVDYPSKKGWNDEWVR
jgi:large subunit ribosomal protein L40